MRFWAWSSIAVFLMVGLCKDARAECMTGYVEMFDQDGEPVCVSEGYLRMQKQIQEQMNRNREKRMQEDQDRRRATQPQTEEEIRQRKYRDTLTREQRQRDLQQRAP